MTVECVVVEADWPNYQHVWDTVKQVTEGSWSEPNTGAAKHPDFTAEQRLQWRMDLVVRHAAQSLVSLETAAEEFKKAEAKLTKSD